MDFVSDFKAALEKRKKKCVISYEINNGTDNSLQRIEFLVGNDVPTSIREMYTRLNGVLISNTRTFELLNVMDIELLDGRFLFFAVMDSEVRICFDTAYKNSAGEWDIVNFNDKYLITMTLASFITNKIWAWIDRGRIVWEEESFS